MSLSYGEMARGYIIILIRGTVRALALLKRFIGHTLLMRFFLMQSNP